MILYVEDNEDIREAYALFLRRSGFKVVEAGTGLEGVSLASELVPDLVLMDICLPDLDGVEATRRIKKDPRTCDVPVIAMSALHIETTTAQEAALLCDGFMGKPLDGAEVVRHVIEFLAATHRTSALAAVTKRTS